LKQETISNTCPSTSLLKIWSPIGPLLFHFSTHSRVVTQCLALLDVGKSAWEAWKSFPDATETFIELSAEPVEVESFFPVLHRFVVLLYDRSSSKTTDNALRKHLFTKKGRPIEGLPPTETALLQHVKRAALQSGYYWHQCVSAQQTLPSPSNWGWVADSSCHWKPLWTTLPDVAKRCPESRAS